MAKFLLQDTDSYNKVLSVKGHGTVIKKALFRQNRHVHTEARRATVTPSFKHKNRVKIPIIGLSKQLIFKYQQGHPQQLKHKRNYFISIIYTDSSNILQKKFCHVVKIEYFCTRF